LLQETSTNRNPDEQRANGHRLKGHKFHLTWRCRLWKIVQSVDLSLFLSVWLSVCRCVWLLAGAESQWTNT